jgi:hypothetical protein
MVFRLAILQGTLVVVGIVLSSLTGSRAGLDVSFDIPEDSIPEIALCHFVLGPVLAEVSGCGVVVTGLQYHGPEIPWYAEP